jgi:hypothetical protein
MSNMVLNSKVSRRPFRQRVHFCVFDARERHSADLRALIDSSLGFGACSPGFQSLAMAGFWKKGAGPEIRDAFQAMGNKKRERQASAPLL